MDGTAAWRKSSFSGQDNQCVEIRRDHQAVRDSKNPTGPTLHNVDIARLLRAIKAD